MNELAHRTSYFSQGEGVEPVLRFVLRWLTPGAALTSVALGTFLLFDLPPGTTTYAPVVLVAAGMSVLLVGLAVRGSSRAPGATAAGSEIRTLGRPDAVRDSARLPSAPDGMGRNIPGVGSEWRILSAPASPGDETWLSWLPRERRRLGPEAGLTVPGVVRSPGQAGNLVAFPVRNYFGAAPLSAGNRRPSPAAALATAGTHSAERPDARAGARPSTEASGTENWRTGTAVRRPFSVEELDRMFPPLAGAPRVFLDDVPLRIGRAGPSDSAGSFAVHPLGRERTGPYVGRSRGLHSRAEDLPEFADIFEPADERSDAGSNAFRERNASKGHRPNDVSLEAANPVPPHLRAQGFVERSGSPGDSRPLATTSSARSVCASCSTVVLNLRMSGPCPKCMRPICLECLREALRSHGRGWCTDCLSHAGAAG